MDDNNNNGEVNKEQPEEENVTLPKGMPPSIYVKQQKRVQKKNSASKEQPIKLSRKGKKQPIYQPKKITPKIKK